MYKTRKTLIFIKHIIITVKKIFIHTVPCEKRSLDAKKLEKYLLKNNYIITNNPKKADIIIVFTCAVFNNVAEESLKKIKELKRYRRELIVAGCLPEIKKEELGKIFNGRCIATKDIENFDKYLPEIKVKFNEVDDANTFFVNYDKTKAFNALSKYFFDIQLLSRLHKKVKNYIVKIFFGKNSFNAKIAQEKTTYIRISSGCPNNCSYCSIKRAVGKLKSKPLDVCLKEFKKGLKQGYEIFRLIADDTGSYGLDNKEKFPDLLNEITKISGDYKIIISALNPQWAVKYKDEIKEILKRKKIIKLEIPIQSGNIRILKLMNRYSNLEKIKETLTEFKETFPDLIIETHGILGFPTETWDEFISTLNFIKENEIYSGFILKYSLDKNTKSGNIDPKIPRKEVLKRMKFTKKFLENLGYVVTYTAKRHNLRFDKYKN